MFIVESQKEITALFNNVSIGIVTVNNQGEIVMGNQFALKQFGYTADELIGQKIEVLIPFRYQDKHINHRDRYLEHPHRRAMGIGMDLFGLKKDGTEFPVEVSLSPYETSDGQQYSVAFISDITIRKEAEHTLLRLNLELGQKVHEFTALFNNAAIGIITVNNLGEIVMGNQFALNQFGYEAHELTGQKIEILIPQRFKPKHVGHRDRYLEHPHNRTMGIGMDLYAMKKDGTEFPVEVSLSPYSTASGKFTIAFVSDITVRKEAEQALLNLNTELEQKVKDRTESLQEALAKEKDLNEMKSRFVSMASHEFRTPLSTILSSAYLALKYETTDDQPKREKHINRIVSSVNMLIDILNEFLSLGKIEEGKIQVRLAEFDIKDTISSVVSEMNNGLKQGQSFHYTHVGPEIVKSDPSLMTHIIMNLFSNAVKFSPENSKILVSTLHENDALVFSVKDNGVGIPLEDQEHLFERFFRARNVSNIQGTGLGLHIIKKYSELINGTIECKSEVGAGTEFIVTIKNTSYLR